MSNREKWEWLLIFWAALSLVPFAFHYRPVWFEVYLTAILVVMAFIFVQRFRRFR